MRSTLDKKLLATIDAENEKVVNGLDCVVTSNVRSGVLQRAIEDNETIMWMPKSGKSWKRERTLGKNEVELIKKYLKTNTDSGQITNNKPQAGKIPQNRIRNMVSQSINRKPNDLVCPEGKWKLLVRSVLRGKNVMMTGPSGTGKTFTATKVAEGCDRPFFYLSLGASQDPRSTLIGNTHFEDGKGTYFSKSLFVKAIQTPNAVILLDELSRANPEAWNILMTVLDEGQRYLRLDEQDDTPTIKVADGVSFVATANIGAEYTMTRVIDQAILSRFQIVEMEALDATQTSNLIKKLYPTLNQKVRDAIGNIGETLRKEVVTEDPQIEKGVYTRSELEIAGLINDGFKLTEACEFAIVPYFNNEGGPSSERTFVKQVIQKYSNLDNENVFVGTDETTNKEDAKKEVKNNQSQKNNSRVKMSTPAPTSGSVTGSLPTVAPTSGSVTGSLPTVVG